MTQTQLMARLRGYEHIIRDWNCTVVDDVKLSVKAIGGAVGRVRNAAHIKADLQKDFRFPDYLLHEPNKHGSVDGS